MPLSPMHFRNIIGFWLALFGLAPSAFAIDASVTFTVNTVEDRIDDNTGNPACHTAANTCSLRAAIMQANHLNTNGLVTIKLPAGIYKLTIPPFGFDGEDTGDLNLTIPSDANQRMIIKGDGAGNTIIDGNQIDGVMSVWQNRVVNIVDVTIRNGFRQGAAPASGGGIDNSGTLTITHCIIENNHANPSDGGGIVNLNVLNVEGSTIRSNVARLGGGINSHGLTTIHDSTIYANGADSGGGIANYNVLYAVNTTISLNHANANGGGIANTGTVMVYNTTIVDNDADHDQNGGTGGGIYSGPGASFSVVNTLVTGNTQRTFDANDCSGTLIAYGWNLFGDVTACTIPNEAAWGFTARNTLGPLQNNGGPTLTHALLFSSTAINTADPDLGCIDETGALLGNDQRGYPREEDQICDVGAYEYGAVVDIIFRDHFEVL